MAFWNKFKKKTGKDFDVESYLKPERKIWFNPLKRKKSHGSSQSYSSSSPSTSAPSIQIRTIKKEKKAPKLDTTRQKIKYLSKNIEKLKEYDKAYREISREVHLFSGKSPFTGNYIEKDLKDSIKKKENVDRLVRMVMREETKIATPKAKAENLFSAILSDFIASEKFREQISSAETQGVSEESFVMSLLKDLTKRLNFLSKSEIIKLANPILKENNYPEIDEDLLDNYERLEF